MLLRNLLLDNDYCLSLWSHVTWPILVAKVELCFNGWNFTWTRKFVKNRFLRSFGKKILRNLWKTSLVLELLCGFRISGEINFFRPLSWGALFHQENTVMNPQNTKCHRSPKITFFRHFSVTKAIHTCTLAKFEKISIVLFSTPLLDFYRRLLLSKV